MPEKKRSWHARFVYRIAHLVVGLGFAIIFRLRIEGRQNIPAGGALVCGNHQSHLDPILIGLACTEPITFLARSSLFKGAFAWLIQYMGAIPINREGLGLGGIKRTMERLKIGEKVLIFPEGTRSKDGRLQPLKPGFTVIAKRSKVPLLPIAIEGAFHAWPRKQLLPKPRTIQLVVGRPITVEELETMDDGQIMAMLQERLKECWTVAIERRQHRMGIGVDLLQDSTQ